LRAPVPGCDCFGDPGATQSSYLPQSQCEPGGPSQPATCMAPRQYVRGACSLHTFLLPLSTHGRKQVVLIATRADRQRTARRPGARGSRFMALCWPALSPPTLPPCVAAMSCLTTPRLFLLRVCTSRRVHVARQEHAGGIWSPHPGTHAPLRSAPKAPCDAARARPCVPLSPNLNPVLLNRCSKRAHARCSASGITNSHRP
jgi:hypothetical protein